MCLTHTVTPVSKKNHLNFYYHSFWTYGWSLVRWSFLIFSLFIMSILVGCFDKYFQAAGLTLIILRLSRNQKINRITFNYYWNTFKSFFYLKSCFQSQRLFFPHISFLASLSLLRQNESFIFQSKAGKNELWINQTYSSGQRSRSGRTYSHQ